MDPNILSAIINSGTTVVIGGFITFFGTRKLEQIKSEVSVQSQFQLEFNKRKREVYENLIKGIQYNISGRISESDIYECKKIQFESYDMLSLWASDKVCNAADMFFKSIVEQDSEDTIKQYFKELLSAMRNDLMNDNDDFKRNYQFIS